MSSAGNYIRDQYLKRYGISGNELGRRLGVSSSTVARLLVGDSELSPRMAIRLSYVLGLTDDAWYGFTVHNALHIAREDKEAIEAECIPFNFAK